ncbi:MAG: rRNA maturation RNase YbeY [Dehalococcoidales bacterium]|jgi:probable rRNA maturation factor|nr:rRNA maturation RNase YbeY [Dehalococcoidales bacterium]MDD4322183.1 rRNA maturation RNase YbeY [Dehalococcoidales bacterium]MDD4794190.1 rRNA maturation RNase YbeY [Dehalococcoidales bacterium]MDD5121858.1 rRNA maturation RNase YbeY [Dehalococcoidales bacterium]MDD5498446.1 rRNA maturation RNase YbeY [Dehalococcoidales bacterium]
MDIEILIDDQYQQLVRPQDLEKAAGAAVSFIRSGENVELGIVITSDEEMQRLNRIYRGIDATTDVLSFAMQDDPAEVDEDEAISQFPLVSDGVEHLGEVIISFPQAFGQAEAAAHSLPREITILVIHGVLHLLGFDHEEEAEAEVMEKHEADILLALESEDRQ